MASILDPLVAEGLTSLRIRHDWRRGTSWAFAAREWEPDRDFAGYGSAFSHDTALTANRRELNDAQTRELYRRCDRLDRLERLLELVAAGRHEGVDLWVHGPRDIRVISNMHSSVLGVGNRRHALRAGGIRRHDREDDEEEVWIDGLNLARAMTFKNAAARIPYGGSKICVVSDPIALDDAEALGFLGWCIDRSRCFTGPDMGFLPEHADALRARFTRNIVGGPGGSLGPTGAPTARGVLLALRQVAKHLEWTDGLRGRRVAVQGLGAVGGPLASALLTDGADLLVADPDADRLQAFLSTHDRDRIQVEEPDAILFSEVDVVSPNALGGVLDAEAIARLRCRVVMGAANNQLLAVSQEEELRLAAALHDRGVLYQVDWMHNAAGVIAGCEEWEHQEQASMDRVLTQLECVCGDGVRQNLTTAREQGVTPSALAYGSIEARIYG